MEEVEAAYYRVRPLHTRPLITCADELCEVACRSIGAGDTQTANRAVDALLGLILHYMSTRAGNLYPVPPKTIGIQESDATALLSEIMFNHIRVIWRTAVEAKSEHVAIHLQRILGMTIFGLSNLDAPLLGPGGVLAIAWPLVAGLRDCVNTASRSGLDNVAYDASDLSISIVEGLPQASRFEDVTAHLIEMCRDVALTYSARGRPDLVDGPVRAVMGIAHHLLNSQHFQWRRGLDAALKCLESLAPIAIGGPRRQDGYGLFPALRAAYGAGEASALPQLAATVVESVAQCENDAEKRQVIGNLIDLHESVFRHFRRLAEELDFDASPTLRQVAVGIRDICHSTLEAIGIADREQRSKLLDNVQSYLSFYWVVPSRTVEVDYHAVRMLAEPLCCIGLLYLEKGHAEIALLAVNHLEAIARYYCDKGTRRSSQELAAILMEVWHVRRLGDQRGEAAVVARCDEVGEQFVEREDERLENLEEDLIRSKDELEVALAASDSADAAVYGSSRSLLRSILWRRSS